MGPPDLYELFPIEGLRIDGWDVEGSTHPHDPLHGWIRDKIRHHHASAFAITTRNVQPADIPNGTYGWWACAGYGITHYVWAFRNENRCTDFVATHPDAKAALIVWPKGRSPWDTVPSG